MIRRTTIEFDEALLDDVRAVLGTSGVKETVDAAFDRVLRQARREAFLKQVVEGDGLDLDPKTFARARPRRP